MKPGITPGSRNDNEVSPTHFTGRLTRFNIFGGYRCSSRDGFFSVHWGCFFAYLHQFDQATQASLIAECKAAQYRRDYPHVAPVEGV